MTNHRQTINAAPATPEPSLRPITAFQLTLTPPGHGFGFRGREFLDGTHRDAVRFFGGSCRGICDDGRVVAEVHAPVEVVRVYLDALVQYARKMFPTSIVKLTVDTNPRRTLTIIEESLAASLDASPFRLTRAAFMKLAAGSILVSNVFSGPWRPAFSEPVAVPANRAAQWMRIKRARADQRLCRIFRSGSEFFSWFNSLPKFCNQIAASK